MRNLHLIIALLSATLALALPSLAQPALGTSTARDLAAISIQDLVRIEGQGAFQLRGVGIVVGLPGTGDSGSELVLARPLAAAYANSGNPLPDLEALGKAKSAAIVWVSCEIPETGARADDRFTITVSAMHSATNLDGGELIIAPLRGPLPGSPVYAFASGRITVEDPAIPTVGKVRSGAQMVQGVLNPINRASFNLILREPFRSWQVAQTISTEINGIYTDLADETTLRRPVATVVDDMTIRVDVPSEERASPSNFITTILTKRFSPNLLDLPAQVIVNRRTGSIVVTGDVEISAVMVNHKNLTITTTTPPPVPSPTDPLTSTSQWTQFGSTTRQSEQARIQDLLAAFKQLDIPVEDQISILAQIHRTGRLHARFIMDD
jgi:flagellar P-ring protein precursor FlgI